MVERGGAIIPELEFIWFDLRRNFFPKTYSISIIFVLRRSFSLRMPYQHMYFNAGAVWSRLIRTCIDLGHIKLEFSRQWIALSSPLIATKYVCPQIEQAT